MEKRGLSPEDTRTGHRQTLAIGIGAGLVGSIVAIETYPAPDAYIGSGLAILGVGLAVVGNHKLRALREN